MPYSAHQARPAQQKHQRSKWARVLIASLKVCLFFLAVHLYVSRPASDPSPTALITPATGSSAWDYDASKAPLGEIDWHQCGPAINATIFDCGHLSAPLDHLRPEDTRRASIYIARHKARNPQTGELTPRSEVLGTIILNPGGPGGSGVDFLTKPRPSINNQTTGYSFNKLTEGKYDYLSFDPRGVGRSWPRADCFANAADACTADATRTMTGIYHAMPGGEAAQAGAIIADFRLTSQLCSTKNETRELLRYVGTTHTARDMRLMYSAVGDPGLNYWGFSCAFIPSEHPY